MTSRKWITDRCTVDNSGCLRWKQAMNSWSQPVARDEDAGKMVNIRREWMRLSGQEIAGKCVICTCDDPRCLTHLEIVTRKELQKRSGERVRGSIKKRLSSQRDARSRTTTKVNMEAVREWRAQGLTGREIAAASGLSGGHAYKIARGDAWVELMGSPFAGLIR